MRKSRWWMGVVMAALVVVSTGLQAPIVASAKAEEQATQAASDEKATPPEAKDQQAEAPASAASSKTESDSSADGKPQAKEEKKSKDEKKPSSEKKFVAQIRLDGSYPEGPTSSGPFGPKEASLASIIDRLDQAAQDGQIAAVILNIDDVAIGRGKVNELRGAIARVRKAGKPVYAQLASVNATQYLLASACNQIVVSPQAYLIIPGVRAEAMFFKGLLDKLGIQMQVLQMGKYKSAMEPLSQEELSQPARENLEEMVDDAYESLVEQIAQDRNLDEDRVKELIDEGLFTAKAAREAGLVDQVLYPDELLKRLEKKLKTDNLEVIEGYKKKKVDTDVSGMAGFMKLMEMALGNKSEKPKTKGKKIAVVYAVGMITTGESSDGMMGEGAMGSKTIVDALEQAAKDDDVLAIVLRIDSPGGSAVASDLIWREVVHVKSTKPIIASMGDVAGSGGYYIAMGAEKIIAEPLSITGSIGVIGGKPVVSGLLDKVGITTETISRGKNAGSMSIVDPFTPEEKKAWMRLMKDTYRQFVTKAAEGRDMPREEVEELAQGRVYTGRTAVDNGLIDELGTLHDAVIEAKLAAGLKADEKIDLWILPQPKSFLERLFADPAAMDGAQVAPAELTKLTSLLTRAVALQRLFTEPSLVLMPQWVTLK